MDAAVTGALIGLGGATIGAVATSAVPMFTMRARRRDELQRGQRELIGELLTCLVAFVHAQAARDARTATTLRAEAVVANEKLLMLANRRDAPHVERITKFVLTQADAHPQLVAAGVEAAAQVLRRWSRGDLRGVAIADAYGPALDIQLDARSEYEKD